jgi:hypothetical protein
LQPLGERLLLHFARKHTKKRPSNRGSVARLAGARAGVLALVGIGYGVVRVAIILSGLQKAELHEAALGLGATFLRVNLALLIGACGRFPREWRSASILDWRALRNRWRKLRLRFRLPRCCP